MASLNLLWLAHDRSELVETVTNFEGETSENRLESDPFILKRIRSF